MSPQAIKCPKCGSTNVYYRFKGDEYECLNCHYKWKHGNERHKATKVELWHRTFRENIPKILREGLKPPEECSAGNKFMDFIADRIGIPKERRRCKAVYLYFPGKAPLVRNEKKEGIIRVLIEPEKVWVADMEVATEALMWAFGGSVFKYAERARIFAERYWEEMIPYNRYIKEKPYFNEPECLVFEPIPPEKVLLADMQIKR